MEEIQECNSRNISLPIQREVRQRCGFGCVICGMPLYEYEHLEEWANVKQHVAKEITLLCDQHHREKTGGLLPKDVVREANEDPLNLREGVSKPYNLHFSGTEACVEIGSNSFTCQDKGYGTAMVPISVDGTPLLGLLLADGHLLLNLVVFDECSAPILHIKNNQLLYSTTPWDIQLIGTTLTVREAHRKILIEIDFQPPNKVVINRGRFLRNGVEILVRPQNILITNNSTLLRGCHAHNSFGGLIVGHHDPPHFHAEYSGNKAVFDFQGNVIKGNLSSRTATKLVREWIDLHSSKLEEDWRLARKSKELRKIEPLT